MTGEADKTDCFAARFDGAEAWARLSPGQQLAVGATALEVVVNWNGMDAYEKAGRARPFEVADPGLLDALHQAVSEAIPDVIAMEPLPVPSYLGQVCRRCGCSDFDPCAETCGWAEPDLCTSCADSGEAGEADRPSAPSRGPAGAPAAESGGTAREAKQ